MNRIIEKIRDDKFGKHTYVTLIQQLGRINNNSYESIEQLEEATHKTYAIQSVAKHLLTSLKDFTKGLENVRNDLLKACESPDVAECKPYVLEFLSEVGLI